LAKNGLVDERISRENKQTQASQWFSSLRIFSLWMRWAEPGTTCSLEPFYILYVLVHLNKALREGNGIQDSFLQQQCSHD